MALVNPAFAATASRIVQARSAAGYETPDAAAIALGISPAVYLTHEQGRARVKPDELRRYAKVFGVLVGWLSSGIGTGPSRRRAP